MTDSRPLEPPDDILASYESEGAALMTAGYIETYWRRRGFLGIEATVTRRGNFFFIRSNVGPNGFPPRRRESADG